MFLVKRTFRGQTKKYPVYTPQEAEEKGIEAVYWKDVRDAGQYGISDDDYIAEVLVVNGPYRNASGVLNYHITLPYCRVYTSANAKIHFLDFYGKGDYTGATPKTWAQREADSRRSKQAIRLYARVLLHKGRLTEKDLKLIGRMYRPDQEKPELTFKRLLKTKEAKQMIQKELTSLLADHNIDHDYVIRNYKEVFQQAQKNKQHGVAKSVLDTFAEMTGIIGKANPAQGALPPGGEEDDSLSSLLPEKQSSLMAEDEKYLEEDDYEIS